MPTIIPEALQPLQLPVISHADEFEALRTEAMSCERCGLCQSREHVVFGGGNIHQPDIAFVAEGPDNCEDETGQPFVGAAGKVLDKMLALTGIDRSQQYVTNSVLCRPPNNRAPGRKELDQCQLHLTRQLVLVKPKCVVALGRIAALAVLQVLEPIKFLRNRWLRSPYGLVRVTYHPSYLLRNPYDIELVKQDLLAVKEYVKNYHG